MADPGKLSIKTEADDRIKGAEVFLQELIVPVGANGTAVVGACGKCGSLHMQVIHYLLDGKSGGQFTISIHCEGQLVFEERATIPDFSEFYDSHFRFFRI